MADRNRRGIQLFHGFKIMWLAPGITRETLRYYDSGSRVRAIIQKNGNVAIAGSGFFDPNGDTPESRYYVAQALYGLKMVSKEFLDKYQREMIKHKLKLELEDLEYRVGTLGYTLNPIP